VIALGQFGDLVCLETARGREIWRKHLEKDFNGQVTSDWGYSESPLVDGDQVVCTPGGPDGTIIALDKKNGATLWRTQGLKDSAAYASSIIAEIEGVRQYIQLTAAHVAGVAAKDGRVLWSARRRGATAVIPTPVYHDNYVYVTSGYGIGCNLFKITAANDTFKAEEVYSNKVMVNHHGGVVLVGDHIYGYSDGKGWTCQDFKTGKMVWEEKRKLGKGALAYADGHLYLRAEDGKGTVVLIEATPSGYKETGRLDQPARSDNNTWAHPVIADGKLYLRDQAVLLCYSLTK
jgi:outer membrane protein assembly factor BamB